MQSQVDTVVQYLAEIPADRRDAIDAARGATLEDLPSGDADFVQTDMAGYCVPLSRYHEPSKHAPLCYVTLSSQENHIAGHLTGYLGDAKFAESGKKRDDLPLDAIGTPAAHLPVDDFTALYERS